VAILFDWTRIVLEAVVPAELAPLLEEGTPVLLRLGEDFPVRARFLRVDPPGADGTVRAAVVPLEPPTVTPGPGVAGRVLLHTGERSGIVVPEAAVLRENGRTLVYVVGVTGELTPRSVGLGMRLPGGRVEITGVDRFVSVAIFDAPKGRE